MVQRYKFSDEYGCQVENDCGDLVTYQDYQKLEAELEQLRQQVKAPVDDGWIEWAGGNCPVPGRATVDVMWQAKTISLNGLACFWDWDHVEDRANIMAYRVVKP